jgi:hypothetical protein
LPYAIIKSFSTMCLWETYPETPDDGPTVELDALAVVTGELYLCGAKSSSGLNPSQIQRWSLPPRAS